VILSPFLSPLGLVIIVIVVRAIASHGTRPSSYIHPTVVYLPYPDRVHGAIHSISGAEKALPNSKPFQSHKKSAWR
jgi:hypothetical protein